MALKKCWKLHKLFLTELQRYHKLDKEGEQVLSSMLNVAKRIPLLLNKDRKNVGVLHYTAITTELLLQRHLASFDKSITFLRDIMRDLFGNVRRLRNYVEELVALVGEIETSGHPENCIILMFQLQEWMENVYIMYERETLRKKAALKDMDFADVGTLQDAYAGWSIHSRHSFVDSEYEATKLPLLPYRKI